MQNYKLETEVKNRADWEKSIEDAKVCIGLKKKRRRRGGEGGGRSAKLYTKCLQAQ